MSDHLPRLRRADCGHYSPEDLAPAGKAEDGHHDVYLCNDCRGRLHQPPRVETKVVEPPSNAPTDWTVAGTVAGVAGEARRVPDGLHPRSREARDFLAAYDAVKGGVEVEGAPDGD